MFRKVGSHEPISSWLYFYPDDGKSGERGKWVLGQSANTADYDLASASSPAVVPMQLGQYDSKTFISKNGNQTAHFSISCMCETMQLTGANNPMFDGVYGVDMKRTIEAGSSPVYK